MSFARAAEMHRDDVVRFVRVSIAFGAFALSTYALAFAVSLLPIGV